VAPGSIHPNGKKYEIMNGGEIEEISLEQLTKVLKPFMKEVAEIEDKAITQIRHFGSDINSISITNVIPMGNFKKANNGEYYGPNPWHGSSTGMNTWVNPTKNVAFCFRCNAGINVAKAIALQEGIMNNCGEDLNKEGFKKVLKVAYEKYRLERPKNELSIEKLSEALDEWEEEKTKTVNISGRLEDGIFFSTIPVKYRDKYFFVVFTEDGKIIKVVNNYLEKIKNEDIKVQSFLSVYEKRALVQAKKIDDKIARGEKISLLEGVPVSIKDIILVKGMKCTGGSKILENYIAPYNATCINKLEKEGVIILGKNNLDEFAMGSSTENSGFKPTRNPLVLSRVPGGSSGGSTAAVAADFSVFSLGSDTGGSIRQPASFCGVVGLKPTYGTVSRYGLMAYSSSLDQIGPITKTIEDSRIVFNAIKGKDLMDSTSVDNNNSSRFNLDKIKNLIIGVPKEYFIEGVDPEVSRLVKGSIKKYEDLGAKVKEVSLPYTKYAIPTYYIITASEASTNLARYDGVKYGFSKGENLKELYFQSRGKGFGKEVRRRIMLGTYALSSGYYDAYYLRAQKMIKLIQKQFQEVFKTVDVIMSPTAPTPAFKIGEKTQDPVKMYLSDIFTVSVNLAGLCGISVPCGEVEIDSVKLPVGLQIIGKPFEEDMIMDVAQIIEK